MRNEDAAFSMADVDLEVANDDGNTMPSADEVRQTHAMSGGDPASVKKSRRRCWMGAVLVICAIGIIAGTAGGKGNERGNAANTGAPRPRPAPSPSRPASAPAPSHAGGAPAAATVQQHPLGRG